MQNNQEFSHTKEEKFREINWPINQISIYYSRLRILSDKLLLLTTRRCDKDRVIAYLINTKYANFTLEDFFPKPICRYLYFYRKIQ